VAMHRRYQHLSRIERGKIMYLKTWGLNVSQIALELGRDKGTISRELRRNRQFLVEYYLDESAQTRADRRRTQASQGLRLSPAESSSINLAVLSATKPSTSTSTNWTNRDEASTSSTCT
jgi:IS30 family transposase